jgi:threonine/homoserine/homoserine lactone efflux protein
MRSRLIQLGALDAAHGCHIDLAATVIRGMETLLTGTLTAREWIFAAAPPIRAWFDRATGCVLVALGVRLALERSR